MNWLTPMKVRKLWLTCEKAYVELDYMGQTMRISESKISDYDEHDLFRVPYEYHIKEVALKKTEPLRLELEDFAAAVEGKKPPLVSGADGLESLRVVWAAGESFRTGEPVRMENVP